MAELQLLTYFFVGWVCSGRYHGLGYFLHKKQTATNPTELGANQVHHEHPIYLLSLDCGGLTRESQQKNLAVLKIRRRRMENKKRGTERQKGSQLVTLAMRQSVLETPPLLLYVQLDAPR